MDDSRSQVLVCKLATYGENDDWQELSLPGGMLGDQEIHGPKLPKNKMLIDFFEQLLREVCLKPSCITKF